MMPPPSTNPEVLRLTEAMKKYTFLFETCSQYVRNLPNKSQLYKEAVEGWKHRSEFHRPRRGDEADRARFFSAVDEVCKIESRSPENCYLIIFACSAAIQIVIDQDLVALPESDGRQIVNESRRLSMIEIKAKMSSPPSSTSREAAAAAARPHLAPVFLPATRPKEAFEEIIDKRVYYRHPRSGETKEYTVTDHITSYLRGTHYLITDSEGREEEVNEREMQDMLDNVESVQQPPMSEVSDSEDA